MFKRNAAPMARRRKALFRADKSSGKVRVKLEPSLASPVAAQTPKRTSTPRVRTTRKNDRQTPAAAPSIVKTVNKSAPVKPWRWLFSLAALTTSVAWPVSLSGLEYTREQIWGVDQAMVAQALDQHVRDGSLPTSLELSTGNKSYNSKIQYSIDPKLQGTVQRLLRKYGPDYGAFVALEPETGRVLAMASYNRAGRDVGNLALQNTFPAASVFKVVTAAAAIDQGKANYATVLPFNGKSTSLYKSNVLKHKTTKWTRKPTLRSAFAKSINTVFARLGIYQIGSETLEEYAHRFGFNNDINGDIPVNPGTTAIDHDDDWSVAEAASGYTRSNTMSPLQGAMIAATIVNDGKMVKPYLVESVNNEHGILLYAAEPEKFNQVVSSRTASQMRILMRETVKSGSARKSFRKFFKGDMAQADVGGKTGTLNGFQPKGTYDWFVGYGEVNGKKIAYAAMCINVEKWYVKSSNLARMVLESYFEA